MSFFLKWALPHPGRAREARELDPECPSLFYPHSLPTSYSLSVRAKRAWLWKWSESEVKWSESESEWRIFLSPISLKLSTLKDQDEKIFAIFVVSDFAQKMWKKIRFKFENREKFYKGFPCKKNFPCESFVKWTQFKITRNSFVKFSAGGPRSIYKGIPL